MAMQINAVSGNRWSTTVPIPFRGDRDYLNGADLYAASSAMVAQAVSHDSICLLDVRFPRFTRQSGMFHLQRQGVLDTSIRPRSSVSLTADLKDGGFLVGWYEEDGRAPQLRVDNHEQTVIDDTTVANRSVSYGGNTVPPIIEVVVYSTKALMKETYPNSSGKWIFTGLRSRFLVDADRVALQITISGEIGTRAIVSTISAGDEILGDIYFSLIAGE